jgi:hypothetical protein
MSLLKYMLIRAERVEMDVEILGFSLDDKTSAIDKSVKYEFTDI